MNFILTRNQLLSVVREGTEDKFSKENGEGTKKKLYYINFSGIPRGSKSINALSRRCDIIFDRSAHSIFAPPGGCDFPSFGLFGVVALVFSRVESKFGLL